MTATVQVVRKTGASGSIAVTDVTSINSRLNSYDTHSTADTTNPVVIPASGTNYSYWATFRLKVTVAPSGTIDNLKFFTDGSNGFTAGVLLKVAKASTGTDAGYRQATGTPGTTGTLLNQTNHTGLDAAPADAFTKTSGSPLTLVGTITATTGEVGDHVVLQTEVPSTVSTPGSSGNETMTFQYDET